jgi:hypothetical protein
MAGEHIAMQLGILIESAGRVQAVAGRSIRWGLASVSRSSGESNRDILLHDLHDLRQAIARIESSLAPAVGALSAPPETVQAEPLNGQ